MKVNVKGHSYLFWLETLTLLGLMVTSAQAIETETTDTLSLNTKELCQKVSNYSDWDEVQGQWVSETFERERYWWRLSHGYPVLQSPFYESSHYDQLTDKALQQLAADNDPIANLQLAQRHYFLRPKGIEGGEQYCYQAVIDGYTALYPCMITAQATQLIQQRAMDGPAPSQKQISIQLNVLAWIALSKDADDMFAKRFAETLAAGYESNQLSPSRIKMAKQTLANSIAEQRNQRPVSPAINSKQTMPALWSYLEQHGLEEKAINRCMVANEAFVDKRSPEENQYAGQ